MKELNEKVAVITGGAAGIGLAVAQACAKEGMKLVLADIEGAVLNKTVAAFEADGVVVIGVVTDVSKRDQVQALADKTIEAFGAAHFLFNNAGVGGAGATVWSATEDDWAWTLGVNLWGVIYGVQIFTPLMLAQDGEAHIVNTASIAGLIAGPSMGPYRVSKHAVVALSETMYCELTERDANVGVSVLCPAWVNTGIHESGRNRPKTNDQSNFDDSDDALNNAQMGQVVDWIKNGISPDDVANAVIDSIRENRFYIYTHPKFMKAVGARVHDVMEGNNPTNLMTR